MAIPIMRPSRSSPSIAPPKASVPPLVVKDPLKTKTILITRPRTNTMPIILK